MQRCTQPRRTHASSHVQEGEERRWGLLDWGAYSQRWQVPWGGRETAGGMALWIAVFLATAFLLAPALYINLGSKVALLRTSCQLRWTAWPPIEAGCTASSGSSMSAAWPPDPRPVRFAGHVRVRADGLGVLCCGAPGEQLHVELAYSAVLLLKLYATVINVASIACSCWRRSQALQWWA